jgi:transcriptional regulator with XRE-family HTH domain
MGVCRLGFQFGYLTPKQRKYWGLRRSGLTQADISRKMDVTRQTINKTFNAIDLRVSKALLEAAQINRIETSRLDYEKGYLLGRSPSLRMDVLITFSERNGIQVWYRGEGDCSECTERISCKQKLLIEAEDRGIQLPEEAEEKEPSELADILFKKILEGG